MAKKFNLGLGNIISNSSDTKKIPVLAKVESVYNINYEILEIEGETKEILIKYENDLKFHKEKTMEHMLKFSKAIFEANQIFSKKGNGNFGKWLDAVEIDRNSANLAIRKYQLYLETEKKGIKESNKVLTLSNRTIKALTSKNSELEEAEVIEVITSENPTEKLKEIESYKEEIKEIDIQLQLELYLKERTKKIHQIERLEEEIKKLEIKINEIKK